MGIYRIDVYVPGGDETIVKAEGSLGLISYAEKEARATLGRGTFAEVTAEVSEISGAGESLRTITSLTADPETVTMVLKGKLAGERKAVAAQEQPTPADQGNRQDNPQDGA